MTGKALDYSQARPPLGKVKANGYSCIYRYVCSDLSEQGLPGKRLTPTERDQILAAGLDIGLHGEDTSGAAQNGYARGKQQAQVWADYASTVLHAPQGMTIVAAIDYDTLGVYPPVVADYLHGVKDGFAGQYAVGVYGSFWVVRGALQAGHAVHGVQTVAWSTGWGPTPGCVVCDIPNWDPENHEHVYRDTHLYQHGGSEFPDTDYNDIFHVPHGSWLQTLNGADMTPDEHAALMRIDKACSLDTTHPGVVSLGDTWRIVNADTSDLTHSYTNASIAQQLKSVQTQLKDLAAAVAALQPAAATGFDMTGTLTPKPTP